MFQMVTISRRTTIRAESGGEKNGIGQRCSCPLQVTDWSSAVQPEGRKFYNILCRWGLGQSLKKGGKEFKCFPILSLLFWSIFFLKSTTSMAIIAKFNGERIIFLTNVAEIITYPCTKKWTLIHSLYHTKSNSKWITGLMVKSETMKLQEENIEGDFCGFGLGKEFLSRYQKYNS